MTDPTPYDADRADFTRQALARLVLSSRAAALLNGGGAIAVTRYDRFTGPGGRAGEALDLTHAADALLAAAVVYERERGSTWADLASHLEMDPADAEERFAPVVARWNEAFETPYRLDPTGRKRIPQLPTAAYDPKSAVRQLDLSIACYVRFDDRHPVSSGLVMRRPQEPDPAPYPFPVPEEHLDLPGAERHPLDGRIRRANVEAFLGAIAHYVHPWDFDRDHRAVLDGLAATDHEDPERWHTHTLAGVSEVVDVRLANIPGRDQVAVEVLGARRPDLRLRIDTLLSIFQDWAVSPDPL